MNGGGGWKEWTLKTDSIPGISFRRANYIQQVTTGTQLCYDVVVGIYPLRRGMAVGIRPSGWQISSISWLSVGTSLL